MSDYKDVFLTVTGSSDFALYDDIDNHGSFVRTISFSDISEIDSSYLYLGFSDDKSFFRFAIAVHKYFVDVALEYASQGRIVGLEDVDHG